MKIRYIDRLKSKIYKRYFKQQIIDNHHGYLIPRSGHFAYFLQLISGIEGAIVEAGVRRGESLATLAVLSKALGVSRKIIAFDSFQGFPPDAINNGKPMPGKSYLNQDEAIDLVKQTFRKANFSQAEIDAIIFIPGYFDKTLLEYREGDIALLHIDVDLGKSYTEALEGLYQHVIKGGVILFDEYDAPKDLKKWPDAKPAIDQFLSEKKVEPIRSGFIHKFGVRKLD